MARGGRPVRGYHAAGPQNPICFVPLGEAWFLRMGSQRPALLHRRPLCHVPAAARVSGVVDLGRGTRFGTGRSGWKASMASNPHHIQAGLVGAVLLLATPEHSGSPCLSRQLGLATPLRTNPEPASVAAPLVSEPLYSIYSKPHVSACARWLSAGSSELLTVSST